jgi:hypothetical protein
MDSRQFLKARRSPGGASLHRLAQIRPPAAIRSVVMRIANCRIDQLRKMDRKTLLWSELNEYDQKNSEDLSQTGDRESSIWKERKDRVMPLDS